MTNTEKHIDFILKDLKSRGEIRVSKITFFGAIYSCKVKQEGSKRAKTVTYSGAENVLKGYRPIKI
ncbi:hypothetical protein [Flectobacillus sp. BAB-3569]|jgi:hypothetical protein|uniref:hypothetical protein n=1 Tax=Flectobacillus sp. BAB-3569 TaxID=1509483 RepID=UPI000BA39CF7|nr:hypothetical protein [Flectobacillus sp. BAB-3569]PAC27836.1 hypothetical protein BWI92_21735 [Flectobacillus sp. BAB-3569]